MPLDLRTIGPAYRLFHLFVNLSNSEGWVKYGAPITQATLANIAGVPVRTLQRWLARLQEGSFIEIENYIGRGLRIRIADQFRSRAYQLPLFNGPQLLRKSGAKSVKP